MTSELSVYLIAGEPSGDILGGRLMAALKQSAGHIEFAGVGGQTMESQGLTSLFPMGDLTVMGLTEVVPRLPKILGRIKQTARDVIARRPDVVVTIDAPDFCFRVAKKLKGQGIPVVHYVAPSVWAWRPGRAKKVANLVDHVMCLLPFEPPYFERAGVDATFVGHSILESGADQGDGPAFREQYGIEPETPVLSVLPGSRMGEISRLLETFGSAADLIRKHVADLKIVIPTVEGVADAVQTGTVAWPNTHVIVGEKRKYDAFAASNAALAASGTVSLELAMAKVPSVIGYRVAPLTAAIAKRLIKVKYASIVNLVLDKPVIPEFIQDACISENLADAVLSALNGNGTTSEDFEQALKTLRAENESPSALAAHVVRRVAQEHKNAGH